MTKNYTNIDYRHINSIIHIRTTHMQYSQKFATSASSLQGIN